MKRSQILEIVEDSITPPKLDILSVSQIDIHTNDEDGYEISPGKKINKGDYGVVESRVIFPLK